MPDISSTDPMFLDSLLYGWIQEPIGHVGVLADLACICSSTGCVWVLHFLLGSTRKTLPSNGVLLNHMSVWYYNVFCSLRDDGVVKDWISCHVK